MLALAALIRCARRHAHPIGLVVIPLMAVGVVRGCADRDPGDAALAYADAVVAAHTRRMAADRAALDSARTVVRHDSVTVTQAIVRYRTTRDTLRLTDTVQVRQFVERSDSVVRACSALVVSCSVLRQRADSVIADLTRETDALRASVAARTPRLSTRALALYDPLAQVPALSGDVAVRVWRGWSVVVRADQRFVLGERPHGYLGVQVTP